MYGKTKIAAGIVGSAPLLIGKKVADIFDMFIGTSAGAFNAACFAYGAFTADKVKRYWSKSYLDRIMKTSFF